MPAPLGSETLETRTLCGFLIHVDSGVERTFGGAVQHVLGIDENARYRCEVEALVLPSKLVAHEIERLAHEPGRSIFTPLIRSLVETDLTARGLERSSTLSVSLYRAYPSKASKLPLRAVIAEHDHGRHLISIAYDEKTATLQPDTDIKVEGFFPRGTNSCSDRQISGK
jgi:hypothetical protein